MLSYFSIIVCACALSHLFKTVNTGPWASPAQEVLDEIHDVEIYRAVVSSIEKWQSRKLQKQLNKREKRENPSVCYANIGCFEAQGPFAYLEMVPGPPEDVGTKFFFYPSHRSRRNGFTQVEVPFSNLSDAFKWGQQGFNKEIPTKVLIHGFGSDCSHIWVYELRSALMAVEEMNIICVDWSKGAELPNYVKAVVNTRLVGKQVSNLLKGLMDNAGLLAKNVHLIGFSLGAHVAGFTGSDLGNLSRITGLDPAGPLFESQDPRARLDQSDADFVDVIHSNGENLILGGLGSWQPLGHVDFYPNGGRMQKGCSNIFLGAVSDIIWSSAIEGRSLCNHRRAYKFFTDSVSPRCHFPAFPCHSYDNFLEGNCFPCTDDRNCGNMGYYADRWNGRGQLYLITRDEEPFCAYQYKINIKSSNSDIPIISYGRIQVMLLGDSPLNETFVMTKKDDEEMVLGNEISRIFVPHPILADPTQIEVLYTAYSGWLSSGLTHWKIDKITLSDSFGKISSICQKSLVLESGKPLILPLHPGDCQLPIEKESGNYTNSDEHQQENLTSTDKFEQRVNKLSLSNAMLIFNLPWLGASDKENMVADEKETSRALNTKFTEDSYFNGTNFTMLPEIAEPVLKPQSRKNARAHHYVEDKSEISEPILGSTTTKIFGPNNNDMAKGNNKEITYDFYDSSKDEWGSIINANGERKRNTHGSEDLKNVPYEDETQKPPSESDGFDSILMTVQFLPLKLAKMFEQAEKYARETILPFVSAHTPKIIRDFIAPEPPVKYLPLHFDDTSDISNKNKDELKRVVTEKYQQLFNISDSNTTSTTVPSKTTGMTTPYTHIQKIFKRREFSAPLNSEITQDAETSDLKPITMKRSNDLEKSKSFPKDEVEANLKESINSNTSQKIYIDLPVFDKNYQQPKYIPIIPVNSKGNGSN